MCLSIYKKNLISARAPVVQPYIVVTTKEKKKKVSVTWNHWSPWNLYTLAECRARHMQPNHAITANRVKRARARPKLILWWWLPLNWSQFKSQIRRFVDFLQEKFFSKEGERISKNVSFHEKDIFISE